MVEHEAGLILVPFASSPAGRPSWPTRRTSTRLPTRCSSPTLLTAPLGNHHVIGMGEVSGQVRDYLDLFARQVRVQA